MIQSTNTLPIQFGDKLVRPTEAFLRKFFIQFGCILDVSVKEYAIYHDQNMQEGYGFITYESEECIHRAVQACQNVIVQGITLKCTITHQHNPMGGKKKGRSPTNAANGMNGMPMTTAPYYSQPSPVAMNMMPSPAPHGRHHHQGHHGHHQSHHQSQYMIQPPSMVQGPAALTQSFQPLTNQMSFLQQAKAHSMPVPQNIATSNNVSMNSFMQTTGNSNHSSPHLSDNQSTTSSLESGGEYDHSYNSSNGNGLPLSALSGVFGNGNSTNGNSNNAAMEALTMAW